MRYVNIALAPIVIFLIFACTPKSITYNKLVAVDSLLLGHNNVDSAIRMLENIEPESEEETSYYNILKVAASYRNENSIKSFDGINASIKYYTDNYDARKLAYAYYYKSTIYVNKDSVSVKMLPLFKNAERHAQKTTDCRLLNRVYSGLTFINGTFAEADEALKCAHKEYYYAKKLNDNYCKVYALMNLSITHYLLHNIDSTAYYIKQSETLAGKAESEDKYFIYNYIGQTIMQNNPSAAKQYFISALKYKRQTEVYLNLARIYAIENQNKEVLKYCDSALINPTLLSKKETYALLADYYYKNDNIEQYKNATDKIIENQVLLSQEKENRRLLELQKKFDYEKQQAEYNKQKMLFVTIISLLMALITVIILFHKVRLQKIREHDLKLENQNAQLCSDLMTMTANEENYKKQIIELEAENQALSSQKNDLSQTIAINKTRITTLKNKVDELNIQKYEYIEMGKTIYQRIEQNQTITMYDDKWANCVYYFALNRNDSIFEDYYKLTISDKIFIIADVFLKKNDEELANIFAISPVTVRTRRSKLKRKKT